MFAVDEISLYGRASKAVILTFTLSEIHTSINLGLNAQGGAARWVACPGQEFKGSGYDFKWETTSAQALPPFAYTLSGYISYLDDKCTRHFITINRYKGRLVPWVLVTKVTVPVFAKLRAEGKMKMENGQIYQRVEP